MKIDAFGAPLMVSWRFTRDCDLACLHCCMDCAPGARLPGELSAPECLRVAEQLACAEVPYVVFGGGEPAISPHFLEVAQFLGRAGVQIKLETNGQRLKPGLLERLARLPVRSIQVSLDGGDQDAYGRLRPAARLEAAVRACRAIREAGLPLEAAFAPTRFNIAQAEAVVGLALELGAFRFNTGRLMRLGRAARLWPALEPSDSEYADFLAMLDRKSAELAGRLELCYRPFSLREGVAQWLLQPPGTLLIQPDGKVRVSPVLPQECADLRRHTLAQAWDAYRGACRSPETLNALKAMMFEDMPVVV
ncbi:MAG: radical SAM protein [Elusimicrobia bacterium]|nr:radical SAM protein [Elusimicrobiota bacterium]